MRIQFLCDLCYLLTVIFLVSSLYRSVSVGYLTESETGYLLHNLTRPSVVMSVNTDDDDPGVRDVVDVISCVALFYEKEKSGNSFLRKEKFRAQLPQKVKVSSVSCGYYFRLFIEPRYFELFHSNYRHHPRGSIMAAEINSTMKTLNCENFDREK